MNKIATGNWKYDSSKEISVNLEQNKKIEKPTSVKHHGGHSHEKIITLNPQNSRKTYKDLS
jgi:hypothetical protein